MTRGENRSTRRKTSQRKDKTQQQNQSTYNAESGNRIWATLVGEECSHHCVLTLLPLQSTILWFRLLCCRLRGRRMIYENIKGAKNKIFHAPATQTNYAVQVVLSIESVVETLNMNV